MAKYAFGKDETWTSTSRHGDDDLVGAYSTEHQCPPDLPTHPTNSHKHISQTCSPIFLFELDVGRLNPVPCIRACALPILPADCGRACRRRSAYPAWACHAGRLNPPRLDKVRRAPARAPHLAALRWGMLRRARSMVVGRGRSIACVRRYARSVTSIPVFLAMWLSNQHAPGVPQAWR